MAVRWKNIFSPHEVSSSGFESELGLGGELHVASCDALWISVLCRLWSVHSAHCTVATRCECVWTCGVYALPCVEERESRGEREGARRARQQVLHYT